jgi:hypothetical protein
MQETLADAHVFMRFPLQPVGMGERVRMVWMVKLGKLVELVGLVRLVRLVETLALRDVVYATALNY